MKIAVKQLRKIIEEEIQRLAESQCPCGIERSTCDYHKDVGSMKGDVQQASKSGQQATAKTVNQRLKQRIVDAYENSFTGPRIDIPRLFELSPEDYDIVISDIAGEVGSDFDTVEDILLKVFG